MSLSISLGSLRRISVGSAVLCAILAGALGRQAAGLGDGGAKPAQTPTTVGATRTVAGRVVDSQGNPVAGAQVWWYVRDEPGFSVRGRTDGGGRFRLSTPDAWQLANLYRRADVIWVLGPTKEIAVAQAHKHLVDSGKTGDAVLELGSAKEVTFQIVSPTEAPVAGATVEPRNYRGGRGIDLIPDPILEALRGTTDAAGRVRMRLGHPDFFNIRVISEQFGIQFLRLNSRDSTPDRTFTLADVGRIEGRVIAKDPKDAIGVRLGFYSVAARTEGSATAVTDERGGFVVPKISSGSISVRDRSAERSSPVRPRPPKDFALRPGATVHLEIPIERLVIVRGSLQTEDTHVPVAGATVGMQGDQAVTDSNGRFEVRVLPGSVNPPAVGARPETFGFDYQQVGAPWNEMVKIPAGDKPFEFPPIVLVRLIKIRGQVVGEDGRPLAKASLCGDGGKRRYGFCETDESGEFSMRVPRTVTLKNYEVWLSPHETPAIVTVVKNQPLVLKAVPQK